MREIRVVAAAIVDGQRVLAARRGPGKAQAGLWELPGGKVEAGEPDAQALAREIDEELGLRIAVGEALGESVHAYEHVVVRLVAYACAVEGGSVAPTEHSEVRWVGAGDLADLEWAPADIPLLEPLSALLIANRSRR